MTTRVRPLSPHLGIYRWQIGNTLSILHRLTGVILSLGLVALTYWFAAAAADRRSYETAGRLFGGFFGIIVLMGLSFAFFYHLLNGVRHLAWDMGRGFERNQRHVSGWLAVGGALLLTACLWAVVWRLAHR